jgi:hypothetical protein
MLSIRQAAQMSLPVQYAMDMHVADRANLAPPPDPRLSPDWKLLGYLTGPECVFRIGKAMAFGDPTCYGFLLRSTTDPDAYVLAIRGTDGLLNWLQDAIFVKTPNPAGGEVERGFQLLTDALTYTPVGAAPVQTSAIAGIVGTGHLTVIGHSLGAAMATLLTLALAAPELLSDRVSGLFWASPHVGDATFAAAFHAAVRTYQLFNFEFDAVPRIPLGLGYIDLPNVTWIDLEDAEARVKMDSLLCQHHLLCYLARVCYSLTDWKAMAAIDQSCASCILGPSVAAAAGGLAL